MTDAGPAAAAKLHRGAGDLATGPWDLALSPEGAGWSFSGLRVATLAAGGELTFDTGPDEVAILPLAGAFQRRLRRLAGGVGRAEQRLRRPDRFRLRAAGHPAHRLERGRRAVRGAGGPGGPRAPVPARGGRRRPDRAARCRQHVARGPQLRRRGRVRRRAADRRRGPDAEWQLGLVPAAQARRGATRRDRARGDLFLRGRARAVGRRRRRVPAGVRDAGPADRRPRRGPDRRRRPDPAWLARSGDGAAWLRPLLPERDGRPRRAGLARLRRPGPCLGQGRVAGPGGRPAAAVRRADGATTSSS